jgi:hypothetical protein
LHSSIFSSSVQQCKLLSYYAPTTCTQKLKLMGKGGQFTYTSTQTDPQY